MSHENGKYKIKKCIKLEIQEEPWAAGGHAGVQKVRVTTLECGHKKTDLAYMRPMEKRMRCFECG